MDADGKTLGRLSTEIATLLQGKHKPIYVRHLNTGDYVVVVNAEKVRVTGKKLDQKVYYRHSGYPGGLKEETLRRVLDRTPTRAIRHAVKGMLPKNTVGRNMLSRLKLYVGDAHPHEAQVRGAQKAEERRLSAEADPAQEAEAETKPRTRARRRAVAPEAAPEAERTNEPSAQAEAIAEPPGQPAEAVAEPPEAPRTAEVDLRRAGRGRRRVHRTAGVDLGRARRRSVGRDRNGRRAFRSAEGCRRARGGLVEPGPAVLLRHGPSQDIHRAGQALHGQRAHRC
jgi:large subunit ribosomal protein L13